jgi:hypothetical protein
MIDPATNKPIRVLSDGTFGELTLSADLLDKVSAFLRDNQVAHWVGHNIISVDGKPPMGIIYLRRGTDPEKVQALLDHAA